MNRIAFTLSLIACLIVAGVGGFLGGQALMPPQTSTITETSTILHVETLTKTLPVTKTFSTIFTKTVQATITKTATETLTVTKPTTTTKTATVTVTTQMGYGVRILKDRDYYYSLKSDLEKAEKEILVAMYLMVYDPGDSFDWANDLIRELVKAEERGVNVEVILEYRTYRGCMDENLEAYHYLKEHGVDVRLDRDKDTDHMKLVVIDGEIVYVGSHNWTEAALYYNHETSIRIVSSQAAKTFKAYFKTI